MRVTALRYCSDLYIVWICRSTNLNYIDTYSKLLLVNKEVAFSQYVSVVYYLNMGYFNAVLYEAGYCSSFDR